MSPPASVRHVLLQIMHLQRPFDAVQSGVILEGHTCADARVALVEHVCPAPSAYAC